MSIEDVGFVLFWIGFTAAYVGTACVAPMLANNLKTAFQLIGWIGMSGWSLMFAALTLFNYQVGWIEWPALYVFGLAAASWGILYAWIKPKEQH